MPRLWHQVWEHNGPLLGTALTRNCALGMYGKHIAWYAIYRGLQSIGLPISFIYENGLIYHVLRYISRCH